MYNPSWRYWSLGMGRAENPFPLCKSSFHHGKTWWCWEPSADSQAWGVGPTGPLDRPYWRPCSGAQRECKGSDSARGTFPWSVVRRISCRLSLRFFWRHADSQRRHHARGGVWYSSVWYAPRSFLEYSTARCLCDCHRMFCHLCSSTGKSCWRPWIPEALSPCPKTAASTQWAWLRWPLLPP